ncbi:hypothetical protein QTJ16_007148 [Diplocarpon rosae]|uniref:Serine hydrolase domain-containing protein n=1 Tax=Diplocarpon rosae TaxID=946125 RepID=A0AAD9SV03_9HELO|nr:hypothetical protein QTJ16_007148 [Diplocarpon rosae]
MRFLCLPGAYGSAKVITHHPKLKSKLTSPQNFEVQLGTPSQVFTRPLRDLSTNTNSAPFCKELSSDGNAEFFFTQGGVECVPPPGFLDYCKSHPLLSSPTGEIRTEDPIFVYFLYRLSLMTQVGPAPHYRFIEYDGIEKNDVLERVRDFPEGENPEAVLRELLPSGSDGIRSSVRAALDAIYATLETHGPFDGICAYSEGAVVGSTLIMDEKRRLEKEGRPRMIKRAVFFAGWPPLNLESNEMLLSDMSEELVDVPTLHCIGADDPYLHGAMALFNICEQDEAVLFDHGKGHTIPRDAQTVKELGDALRELPEAKF